MPLAHARSHFRPVATAHVCGRERERVVRKLPANAGPFPRPQRIRRPAAKDRERNRRALATASSIVSPRASLRVIADESTHPVPCVFFVMIRLPENQRTRPSAVARQSWQRSPGAWPPFTSTAQPYSFAKKRAAAAASTSVSTFFPLSSAASSQFGVTSIARGNSSFFSAFTPTDDKKRVPLVELTIGSTTKGIRACRFRAFATARTASAPGKSPVLIAATGKSFSTASI